MLTIHFSEPAHMHLTGRFTAAEAEQARDTFGRVAHDCTVSFANVDYISSSGLTVLLETQKRLNDSGHQLHLVDLRPSIKNVFYIAGFDAVFNIE